MYKFNTTTSRESALLVMFYWKSSQKMWTCLTSLSQSFFCSSCLTLPFPLLHSYFACPWHGIVQSFVLFSPLNGPSHFTELALWPSTPWKWHEKRLWSFVLWRSVIGPLQGKLPVWSHRLSWFSIWPCTDPLLSENATEFANAMLTSCKLNIRRC